MWLCPAPCTLLLPRVASLGPPPQSRGAVAACRHVWRCVALSASAHIVPPGGTPANCMYRLVLGPGTEEWCLPPHYRKALLQAHHSPGEEAGWQVL